MDGPRAPLDAEFPTVVQFLNQNLRPQTDWSIQAEYPVALGSANLGNIRIIKDADQVLSHAVMRPLIVKSPAGLFKVAGIGSVVTSSHHRNQGLSSTILDACLKAAREHGCDFAILWTDLYDFYRKLGFELAGNEVSIVLEKEMTVEPQGLKILETTQIAADAILRLFQMHSVTSLRTLAEIQQYMRIPNTRIYTAWDSHGTMKAFAVEGKGVDLKGYIHEWGGSVSAMMALLAHIRRTQGRPITVILPSHAQNMIRALKTQSVTVSEGFLGMIKILNTANLLGKINRYARNLGVPDLLFENQGERTFIGLRDNVFQTDSESDLVRLIFGPSKASSIYSFEKPAAEILEAVLPIPMWIWGWDSI